MYFFKKYSWVEKRYFIIEAPASIKAKTENKQVVLNDNREKVRNEENGSSDYIAEKNNYIQKLERTAENSPSDTPTQSNTSNSPQSNNTFQPTNEYTFQIDASGQLDKNKNTTIDSVINPQAPNGVNNIVSFNTNNQQNLEQQNQLPQQNNQRNSGERITNLEEANQRLQAEVKNLRDNMGKMVDEKVKNALMAIAQSNGQLPQAITPEQAKTINNNIGPQLNEAKKQNGKNAIAKIGEWFNQRPLLKSIALTALILGSATLLAAGGLPLAASMSGVGTSIFGASGTFGTFGSLSLATLPTWAAQLGSAAVAGAGATGLGYGINKMKEGFKNQSPETQNLANNQETQPVENAQKSQEQETNQENQEQLKERKDLKDLPDGQKIKLVFQEKNGRNKAEFVKETIEVNRTKIPVLYQVVGNKKSQQAIYVDAQGIEDGQTHLTINPSLDSTTTFMFLEKNNEGNWQKHPKKYEGLKIVDYEIIQKSKGEQALDDLLDGRKKEETTPKLEEREEESYKQKLTEQDYSNIQTNFNDINAKVQTTLDQKDRKGKNKAEKRVNNVIKELTKTDEGKAKLDVIEKIIQSKLGEELTKNVAEAQNNEDKEKVKYPLIKKVLTLTLTLEKRGNDNSADENSTALLQKIDDQSPNTNITKIIEDLKESNKDDKNTEKVSETILGRLNNLANYLDLAKNYLEYQQAQKDLEKVNTNEGNISSVKLFLAIKQYKDSKNPLLKAMYNNTLKSMNIEKNDEILTWDENRIKKNWARYKKLEEGIKSRTNNLNNNIILTNTLEKLNQQKNTIRIKINKLIKLGKQVRTYLRSSSTTKS